MKSYFFIPASRLRNIKNIQRLNPDSTIIDFEDAILGKDIDNYFKEIKDISNFDSYWFRLPIRNDFKDEVDLSYVQKFTNIGIKFIVLPKIKTAAELINICNEFKNTKFIILIEHPRLLLEMRYILMNNISVLKNIVGLGMGSHDLTTFLSAKHEEEQLDYPRKEVLYIAKAYNFLAIDIASMEIFDKTNFIKEVEYGKDNGYDAKFIIHPRQLSWLKNNVKNESKTLNWAISVLDKLPKNYAGEDVAPFVLNNEVIEKPHAIKALEIIKKHNNG